MKALILNSGMGTRMGVSTQTQPKCMTELSHTETILSRQLSQIAETTIEDVIITTGLFDSAIVSYCHNLKLPLNFTFVKNPLYQKTNYIYSIYCAREYLDDDIILMHGDLVFEKEVLDMVLSNPQSCMAVSSVLPLPEKDFKAVIKNGLISKIGIEFFEEAVAAQPLYKLNRCEWKFWLDEIITFCENDNVTCYAENAFNVISEKCRIHPLDVKNILCNEIDTLEDLKFVLERIIF